MSTYLLTVAASELDEHGLRLIPGIRPSETQDRPAIQQMGSGAPLELRRPDGSRMPTVLVRYGISVFQGDDGKFYIPDDPSDPEIQLTIPGSLSEAEVPPGTEVWLLSQEAAKASSQVE